MTAFDQAWGLLKDYRFDSGFPGILTGGGYDMGTGDVWANLGSHTQGFKMNHPDDTAYYTRPQIFRSDRELIDRIVRILSHESTHQALNPPLTDDVWDAASVKDLPDDISDKERARHQAKVNSDWERFQEYGAWSATPGVDEDEKWRMLELYGIEPRGDDQ